MGFKSIIDPVALKHTEDYKRNFLKMFEEARNVKI